MALSLVRAIPGAPEDVRAAVEAAHAALHETRCQAWLRATGHRPVSPYAANRRTAVMLDGKDSPVPVAKTAVPVRGESCEYHPVEESP